jgi:hypothetical protein
MKEFITPLKRETILLRNRPSSAITRGPWNPTTTVVLGSHASSLLRFARRYSSPKTYLRHWFRDPTTPDASSTNNGDKDKHSSAIVYGVSTYHCRGELAGVVLVWGRTDTASSDVASSGGSQKSEDEPPWMLEIYPWVPELDTVNCSLEGYCYDFKSVRKLITLCRGLVNKTKASDLVSPEPEVWATEILLGEKRLSITVDRKLVEFLDNQVVVFNVECKEVQDGLGTGSICVRGFLGAHLGPHFQGVSMGELGELG